MKKYFIGIDFSGETFDATLVTSTNLTDNSKHEKFSNSKTGINKFIAWMKRLCGKNALSETLICGETTGICTYLFCRIMEAKGYTLWIESALKIKNSSGLQRGKNDKVDSYNIALYAYRFQDLCVPYKSPEKYKQILQVLFNERKSVTKDLQGAKCRRKQLEVVVRDIPELKGRLRDHDKKIQALQSQINKLDKEIKAVIEANPEVKKTYDILTSMKGIGPVNAVAFIIYTENFTRFDYDYKKICTYWGVAPFEHTSGTSLNGKPHVSPYANKYLKSLLTLAIRAAIKHCKPIKEYAERLLAKGKHINVVRNNCKNKMIKMLVTMVKNNTTFNENAVSKNLAPLM